MIFLDTHILLHLYLGNVAKLSSAARQAIEKNDLLASPAAVLELEYLHEIGRLAPAAVRVTAALSRDLGLRICDLPFHKVVEHALGENWGRDPFDRLIVGHAKARQAALVTRDEKILGHYRRAIW